jgi:hypothetical protein
MALDQHQSCPMGSGADGQQLVQDVLATSTLVKHILHPSCLALNLAQSFQEFLLGGG